MVEADDANNILKGELKITVGNRSETVDVSTKLTSISFNDLASYLQDFTGGTVTYADNKIQIDGVELTIEGTDADGKA
mgnify:FL=1